MNINLHNICKQQDTEICAVKLNLSNINIVIISIYRSLPGNFIHLKKIDSTLNLLQNNKNEVMWGYKRKVL